MTEQVSLTIQYYTKEQLCQVNFLKVKICKKTVHWFDWALSIHRWENIPFRFIKLLSTTDQLWVM